MASFLCFVCFLVFEIFVSLDFIGRKENINKQNCGGWTPLMYASYVGRDNILNLLLEAGAKTEISATKDGLTALMLASYCATESIMYFLLQVYFRFILFGNS